jgi:hypothetical protein
MEGDAKSNFKWRLLWSEKAWVKIERLAVQPSFPSDYAKTRLSALLIVDPTCSWSRRLGFPLLT